MRHRAAMTVLLLVTLFMDYGTRKVDAIKGPLDSQKNFSSKRRILERLMKLDFHSTEHEARNSQNINPQKSSAETSPHLNSSFLKWYQSNQLPDKEHHERDVPFLGPVRREGDSAPIKSVLEGNIFYDLSEREGERVNSDFELLLKEYEQSEMEVKGSLPSKRQAHSSRRRERRLKSEKHRKRREKKKRRREKKLRRRLGTRINELIDLGEIPQGEDGVYNFECCPSKREVVQIKVGKDREKHAVDIKENQQYFYEVVCLPEVEGKECLFPDRSRPKRVETECIQQISFVQALVKPYNSGDNWKMDYIQVRSGCSCNVSVNLRKKRKKKPS